MRTGGIDAQGAVSAGAKTVATLPAASANEGNMFYLSDIKRYVYSDGTLWRLITVGGNVLGTIFKVFEDTSFVVGESPATLDLETALGYKATYIEVTIDGAGAVSVESSNDGVAYGGIRTVKAGESFLFPVDLVTSKVRLTHTGVDSSYRVVFS